VTDLDELWLQALQQVVGRAAHEVKDSLNGVSLNLEVIRSRASRPNGGGDTSTFNVFATAASEQLELLAIRTEAVLFLARPAREPADVAVILGHLSTLLIPATKADGGRLAVDGYQTSAPTSAPAQATRLALAAGLLSLTNNGSSGHCWLESGPEPVVHFSHESAVACSLDRAVASAVAGYNIRVEGLGPDLVVRFPGSTAA
jgi:hypothetical protein